MLKKNFFMLTALLILSACSSNVSRNKASTSVQKNVVVEEHIIRDTVDPRPAINDHVDNVNRYVGTTTTITHDNKPTK